MDSREVKIEQMDTGNEPTSPLGPLDPSRLRDMVVDQQHFPSQHHPPNVMPAGQMSWQSEQTMRPTHMQGIPMDVQQTSQGPPQSTPQGPIPPQSPMGSPAQMSMNPSHNPQSQQPQGYDALPGYPPHQQHQPPYQMPPQSPSGAQMPPTAGPMPSPGNPMYQQRMMQMQGQSIHPQQYPLYPQNGQWPQPGTAYPQGGPRVAAQPQGMPQQRPMPIHRVPFPGGPGYPAGVPQGAAFRGAPTRPGQYPPGAAPPGYGYPGQPSQGYPPQGIPAAYQRPPQSQPMRPYINSPQTAMMGANVTPKMPYSKKFTVSL
ncbi:unnamed protein product, partial [Mesorhabditis belari]|uniref:Uncharacterized protein n=1 Tax=Mesorhabditis belari TaxID=2138241 RepID=A0AAF3FBG2_9BILA